MKLRSNDNLNRPFLNIYKAEFILLFVTLLWGLSFPLIKISLQFISPLFFNLIRFLISLIIFYFISRKSVNISEYRKLKYGIILGIYLFAGFTLQTIGLKYTTATKSAFITGSTLIIIPFAQYLILKIRPKPENIAGAVIVVAGLYILSGSNISIPNTGDILTFLCAAAFAVHVVYLNKYSEYSDLNHLVLGQFFTMVVLSFLFMFIFDNYFFEGIFMIFNKELILSLIYTSMFSTLISFFLMTKYQQLTTPLRAGIIYNMESVFAVIFAYIILNEVLYFNQVTGIIIMFAGLFISEFYSYFKDRKPNEKKI